MNAVVHPRITLKQYYSSFRGLSAVLAAIAVPFVSKFVGSELGAYLFPPLGIVDVVARLGLVLLGIGMTLVVYFSVAVRPAKYPSRMISIGLLVAFLSLIGYLALYQRFVRRIYIPSRETSLYVSIGYQRTAFADQTFGSASDGELLRARGTSEEDIEQLWTMKSLITARLGLYLSYSLIAMSLLFVFSFGVAHDASGRESTGVEKAGVKSSE